jgi:hypothetical protein
MKYDDFKNDLLRQWPMNRKDEVLLIGGCLDGTWMRDPRAPVFVTHTLSLREEADSMWKPETETYRREEIRAGNRKWTAYIDERLTIEDACWLLITGYRSK